MGRVVGAIAECIENLSPMLSAPGLTATEAGDRLAVCGSTPGTGITGRSEDTNIVLEY